MNEEENPVLSIYDLIKEVVSEFEKCKTELSALRKVVQNYDQARIKYQAEITVKINVFQNKLFQITATESSLMNELDGLKSYNKRLLKKISKLESGNE